jgi:energy-converting hydrogenase B subunit I
MTRIVKTTSLIIFAPIVLFGLYIISHGHLTPGGGFQGGAVAASAIALVWAVFRSETKFSAGLFSFLESLGLFLFILLAFGGLARQTFLSNFLANTPGFFGQTINFGVNPGFLASGGVIPLMNLAIGLEVFAALSLVIILIAGQKHD